MSVSALDSLIVSLQSSSLSSTESKTETEMGNRLTRDVAWKPLVPLGHTNFSWTGSRAFSVAAPTTSATPIATEVKVPEIKTESAEVKAAVNDVKKEQKKQQQEKKPKEEKPPKEKKAETPVSTELNQPPFSALDIRVGKVVKAWKHPDADTLYVEQVDVGEAEPRQIVSGLYKYIPESQFNGADVLVVCNLKPSPLRKITSYGMILAASVGENEERKVELVHPASGSKPGERVSLEGEDYSSLSPLSEIDPKKNPILANLIFPTLKTNQDCIATFDGKKLVSSAGPCFAPSLANCDIK